MKRGEIWWVNFDPSQGVEIKKIRPAVIITVDPLNRARGTVVVIPLSTSAKERAPLVLAMPSAGEHSVAVCDQLCAADKSRLTKKIGVLAPRDLKALEAALKIVLGLQ